MRLALVFLFAALLATPLVYKHIQARDQAVSITQDQASAINRYGFVFQETGKAAGLNFKYVSPVFDPKIKHIMPEVASMGAAVSVVEVAKKKKNENYENNRR